MRAFLEKRPPRWSGPLTVRTLIHDTRLRRSRWTTRARASPTATCWSRTTGSSAVGAGARARPTSRSSADRRARQGRAARPREHAPPPAADADAQRPARAGGAALPLAHRAVRGLARRRRRTRWTSAARVGLGELLLTGCTTTTDHLYLFPRGQERLIDVEIAAARELGIRFHPTRGSMSRGQSQGGLPPDDVVQDEDAILADSPAAHPRATTTRGRGAMTRIALAPCSPFSVTDDLMRRTAELAREQGRAPAHPPGGDARTRTRTACRSTAAGRSSTCGGWAGSGPTSGWPTAST